MDSYCVHKSCFSCKNQDWAKNYLYTQSHRITEMILPILGAEFFKFYESELKICFTKGHILLRVKIYIQKQNNICIIDLWKNYNHYQGFLNKMPVKKIRKAFQEVNLHYKNQLLESVCIDNIHEEIEKMKFNKNIIWQFVNENFKKNWMILGDPIKKRGHK